MDFAQNFDALVSKMGQMQINKSVPKDLKKFAPEHSYSESEKNDYRNHWLDLIETEKAQNIKDSRNELALQVIFSSIQGNTLIFYQKFYNEQECRNFETKVIRFGAKNLQIVNAPQSGLELVLQGKIRNVNSNSRNNPPLCIIEITSKAIAARQLPLNSTCLLYEEKPDFSDLMISNTNRLCDEYPDKYGLIGSLKAPSFNGRESFQQYEKYYTDLDRDQKQAIEKCLKTNDYSLIHGLPGTGKTHVIVRLLRILVEREKKILVSAYTNFAIDNILERFARDYPELKHKIVRMASDPSKVSPKLQEMIYPKKWDPTDDRLYTQQIIAVTCHSAGMNAKLKGLRFDTCIIDEASQAPQPIIFGPLMLANRFILVGDHYQLEPLIRSPEAKEGKMNLSLFERLAQAHPFSVSKLAIQYRMNKEIMHFSNTIVYDKKMSCGTQQVETGRLRLGSIRGEGWVKDILDPNKPVVFLDLSKSGDGTKSDCKLASYLVEKLISSGMDPKEIGVITPLNESVNIIKQSLKDKRIVSEVFTIDSCQGIDRECMILNFSLEGNRTHGLLSEWKRVNVAFTRAKHKLIMIGSSADLLKIENMNLFMKLVKETSQVYNVNEEHINILGV